MGQHTWDEFVHFVAHLRAQTKPDRQGIRVVRDSLQSLVERSVLPHLSAEERSKLFPLGYDPEQSDLKIAAGVGIERGHIQPDEYEAALRADERMSLFSFLQPVSGKTLGETIAPQITEFWLKDGSDTFSKMKATDLYDIDWVPHEGGHVRIELKASTEEQPRFQQIRHPRMTNPSAPGYEYDALACLHVSNAGLEWWVVPAANVLRGIEGGEITPQHGGRKVASGTYWMLMNDEYRARFAAFKATSERLRDTVRRLVY